MENRVTNTSEFKQENFRLAGKYNFIVYPIDQAVLRKVLSSQNYQLTIQDTAILSINGIIGKKDGITVDVQTEGQVVGVSTTNPTTVLSTFEELEGALSEEIGERLDSKARFYEAIIQFQVKTSKNPMHVMAQLEKNYPYCEQISKIIGEKVAPLSIRFSPANRSIESEDWFDFRIEPMPNKATSSYLILLIFRSGERQKVIEEIKNSRKIASDSLNLIEGV